MSLIGIIVAIIVVGVLLWLTTLIPMDGKVRQILQAVVIIVLVIWLLKAFGLLTFLQRVHV